MHVLEEVKALKEQLNLLEANLLKPKIGYPWDVIENTFKQELPMLSSDAIQRFHQRLDGINPVVSDPLAPTRKYGKRRKLPNVPLAIDMTPYIIDYLKTCQNRTASKAEIFEAIKGNYSADAQAVRHRSRGTDHPTISAIEYRVEWACAILSLNGRTIGRNQDPLLSKKHIKLINATKFTDAEIAYLKKNRYSLVGFNKNKK